jgi:hypothetical protein
MDPAAGFLASKRLASAAYEERNGAEIPFDATTGAGAFTGSRYDECDSGGME